MAGVERIGGERFAAQWMRSRVLRIALAASVALHLAVLLGLPELIEAQRKALFPGPLNARLVSPPPPKPQAELQKAEPVAPAIAKPSRPAPVAAKTTPIEHSTTVPVLAAPAPASAAPPAASSDPSPASVPAAAAASTGTEARGPESRPTAPVPALDEAGSIAQYRIALMNVARGLKTYPRIAQENNWQGRVELRITINAGGGIAAVAVKTGTGYTVLDQSALDLLRRAQPGTPLPAALRGREFTLEVPVVYGLKDG